MRFSFYKSGNPLHDRYLLALFRSFTKRDGWSGAWVPDQMYAPADVGVIWGKSKKAIPISWWRDEIAAKHKTTVILDSGYIKRGDGPENHQAVGLNGLNGRADFKREKADGSRWEKLGIELKPWRKSGSRILLAGQVPWDVSVQHMNHVEWLTNTAAALKERTDRPIVFRPHPRVWKDFPEIPNTVGPAHYDEDFWAVVTYSSNTAVDAILNGVPVIALDSEGSMAKGIASHSLDDIENPPTPDRTRWCHEIAYAQWTLDEMLAGLPWEHLF